MILSNLEIQKALDDGRLAASDSPLHSIRPLLKIPIPNLAFSRYRIVVF
jgi:hypothetical protein